MRLYLAGVYNFKYYLGEDIRKSISTLESFYYVQGDKAFMEYIVATPPKNFLLDSGAYSFLNAIKTKKNYRIDWDSYLSKYIEFIKATKVKDFFELDIDSLVGIKKVEEFRDRLERETGMQSIPVWHFGRGKDYFIEMCKNYSRVAFGGILTDGIKTTAILKALPWFTKTAREHDCIVHGLGLSHLGIEKLYTGLDSVDSTTWTSGSRFGKIFKFTNNKIRTVYNNCDPNKRVKVRELTKHNFEVWLQYQKYLERF